ncbi:MAG: CoB--CoM heterodisulfide reductase iron-sulfur subunit B family protein [Candidatus Bathyarchaeota archaeon]|nr:CoB--CoM heterodisulfide reductase iron-sulfur subunit B family protein [Candidatus Bathyarchaeota archaeon]
MGVSQRYLIYLGCVIPYRVSSYEVSARRVLNKLDVELVEMPEFNCCGLPLEPLSHKLTLILSARNLAIAEQTGLNILTLCPGCAGTLKKTSRELKESRALMEEVNKHLGESGLEFKGNLEVKHVSQVLIEDVGLDKIKKSIVRPLRSLRVAEHSGCHLSRPKKHIGFEDPENPQALKMLIGVTGAKAIEYVGETECCGSTIAAIDDKVSLSLVREKLLHVREAGADALITICPACHIMYDVNQSRAEKMFGEKYNVPVLHYTQLLGLAMGMQPEELGFEELRVKPIKLLEKIQSSR